MDPDIILTLFTLAVAIIGTLWKDPPLLAKVSLIAIALGTSICSIKKSISDASDKEFLKAAVTSTLAPPNYAYDKMWENIYPTVKAKGYDGDMHLNHVSDGMILECQSKDGSKKGVTVLSKYDVGILYARILASSKIDDLINTAFETTWTPSEASPEFWDKVGVLGVNEFAEMGRGSGYFYDAGGVSINFEDSGQTKSVTLKNEDDDMKKVAKNTAPNVFYALSLLIKARYETAKSASQ
jgi:hypothetical protein